MKLGMFSSILSEEIFDFGPTDKSNANEPNVFIGDKYLSTGQKMQKRVAKITGKGFDRKLLDIKQTLRYNEPT